MESKKKMPETSVNCLGVLAPCGITTARGFVSWHPSISTAFPSDALRGSSEIVFSGISEIDRITKLIFPTSPKPTNKQIHFLSKTLSN